MKSIPKRNAPLEWPFQFRRTRTKTIQSYRHKAKDGALSPWGPMGAAMDAWREHGGIVQCGYFAGYKWPIL